MRKGSLDRLRRSGSYDDRLPGGVRFLQRALIGNVVEHERLADVELTFDGDLRDAPSRRSEPALSHSSIDSPGSMAWTSTPLASCFNSSGVPARSGNVP